MLKYGKGVYFIMIIDLNQILSTFNIDYEIAKGNNQTEESVGKEVQEEKKDEHCSRISGCGKTVSGCSGAGSGSCEFSDSGAGNDHNTGDIRLWENHIDEDGEPSL